MRRRPTPNFALEQTAGKAEHERQLLRLLATGEKVIAAGQGYDLDEVLNEADALLGRATK